MAGYNTLSTHVHISDVSFAYLKVQRGSLDQYKHDRTVWEREYKKQIIKSYNSMYPFLPVQCRSILDVGSGLGGVDILLRRHYQARGQQPHLTLLDGENSPPEMLLHRQAFGSRAATIQFHADNSSGISYRSPEDLTPLAVPADLVVSTGAWCFHFEPDEYLNWVLDNSTEEVVIIVDVRNDKGSWLDDLTVLLDCVGIAAVENKRTRRVFNRRGVCY